MKLAAVTQREARKDFIDLYVLIKQHKPLEALLTLYQKKYRQINLAPVLMSLVYFDDAEGDPEPANWSVPWSEVKHQMNSWVKQIS